MKELLFIKLKTADTSSKVEADRMRTLQQSGSKKRLTVKAKTSECLAYLIDDQLLSCKSRKPYSFVNDRADTQAVVPTQKEE